MNINRIKNTSFFLKYIAPLFIIGLSFSGFFLKTFKVKNIPPLSDIHCMSYDPNYAIDFDPKNPTPISPIEIEKDIKFLSQYTKCLRLYTSRFGHEHIPKIAKKYNMTIIAGAWVTDFHNYDVDAELQALIQLVKDNTNIEKVIVGNEVMLLDLTTADKIIKYIEIVKKEIDLPVSTTLHSYLLLRNMKDTKRIAEHTDFLAIHLLPYWYRVKHQESFLWIEYQYGEMKKYYPKKPIFIAEVGHPSRAQRNGYTGKIDLTNQALVIRKSAAFFNKLGVAYNIMGAFDQPWQYSEEGGISNVHFGIFKTDKTEKFPFLGPIPNFFIEDFYIYTHIIIMISIFFSLRTRITHYGMIKVLITIHLLYISTIFMLDNFITSYPRAEFGHYLFGFNLICYMVFALFLLYEYISKFYLIEKIEQKKDTEALENNLDFLVVIPFTNEPISILKRSIVSIQNQDHKSYKTILVANNYEKKNLAEIELFIKKLKNIELVDLGQVDGSKAGAINMALKNYKGSYNTIALLDCDYMVEKNWLLKTQTCMAGDTNIVFYPQAYEKPNDHFLTNLILNEYNGNASFSLPLRMKENVGIINGAMLCIDKDYFFNSNMFTTETITEDADFGVNAIINGEEVFYHNEVLGRGVLPSSYKSYCKQRERWVIGACQTMKKHFMNILKTKYLSNKQKVYLFFNWLPWVSTCPYLILIFYQFTYLGEMTTPGYNSFLVMDDLFYSLPFPFLFIFLLVQFIAIKMKSQKLNILNSILTCVYSLTLLRVISISIVKAFVPFVSTPFNVTNKVSTKRYNNWFPLVFNVMIILFCGHYTIGIFKIFPSITFELFIQILSLSIIGLVSTSELLVSMNYNKAVNSPPAKPVIFPERQYTSPAIDLATIISTNREEDSTN